MSLSPTTTNNLALTAICLAALMFGLEISSVPTILPTLEQVLHGSFRDMQWIMNAYTIACTTVLMPTGTLADRFGRKRLFVVTVVAFGITSLLCGLAPSTPVLIVGRFLQGLSGGAMLICQIAILSHQFREPAARGRAFGVWGIVFGLGLGFGPIIGGAIVALSGWPWVFLVHVVIAAVTLVLVAVSVAESRDPNAGRVDLPGIVTLSLGVFGLTFYITQGPDLGFDSPTGLAIIAAATVSLVAFVLIERSSRHPMFDASVFRIRNFSGALFGSMGMNFSFWPFMIYLPIYFQSGLGYDPLTTGLSLLAYTLPTLVFPPLGERLALRYRPGVVIPAGLFTIGAGFLLMRFGSAATQASWLTMLPGALLAGIGLGITNTPVTNTTTGSVSPDRAGMASGLDISARLISLAINIAVMGFLLEHGILTVLRDALPTGTAGLPLRDLAGRIAAGHVTDIPGASADLVHTALVSGFGTVLLYGGLGVWVLAAASYLTFRPRPQPATCNA
ncbi:MFS transporter [Bradyrhizobium sp. U87765 SZCCT0131]|uniref:MFS transporter n=1 Tax=unclassified Bradyrhizobium TaxID=2631580 RepID=UPI001BAA4C91|nr:MULTISPECIES: MFS transporter [unclassified Bradyrhizobium]MBR1221191.1 MFS transporter [Bradyrhizobium sp. U87765 SZCCT0131]MBR1259988.1 MFS transporter [Bradyrhizobium sp. U87765 SZCCT0134]MBR1307763.1 MFS transporter [Bradyrhizobium sp. U87765 SZCCT0110]MBR1321717.1 MFS transporter [Bradyrhizobium sp. U87765 SZCCT0109]MBR1350029.1 MFS transporter [Bradyrhizobium sp. U87765 SZCCT0048]